MAVTDAQWKVATSWIGTNEDRPTFDERFERLGSLDLAIEESMRAQLSEMMLSNPSGVSLPDGTSAQFGANIQALTQQLKHFISIGGTTEDETAMAGPGVTRIVRKDLR